VVEHSTADREVHGSTPCAPYSIFLQKYRMEGEDSFKVRIRHKDVMSKVSIQTTDIGDLGSFKCLL
jgi:hypothetical protein